ncbi:MAG: TlpA family protein disulfide reductase [Flavisolibacter sp.]
MRSGLKLLLLLITIPVNLFAQEVQHSILNIGDPAPPLRVSQWIKGIQVPKFKKGRVYVIEFWATWCKPCLAAMPHLSALAREYKDKVDVIAIDIYESKTKPVKTSKRVKDFVDSIGNKMDFNVAIEERNFTVEDWIVSTEEQNSGIPRTFVIDENGKLAWIGKPSELEEVLLKILNSSWDINEELKRRNENKRIAILDDSLNYVLMRFTRNQYNMNDTDNPDSALLMINEIVKNEPKLKYAPFIASNTFNALLKTDPQRAYEYGKIAIVTPTYDSPPCDFIISKIKEYSNKLNLPSEIYELGAEAYQEEINQIHYPELVNLPRFYNNMAEMYRLAKNKVKAVESIQKAIELSKSKKDVSKKEIEALESTLQQYKKL